MKIAVASDGKLVAGHFGHCEGFNIFTVQGNSITESKFVPNPGHRPGFLPNYLYELGVNVIISGGMGGGAIEIFNERGIEVVTGASGDSEENVKQYIAGNLKSTGSVCHQHEHSDSCGGH